MKSTAWTFLRRSIVRTTTMELSSTELVVTFLYKSRIKQR
jgi:hypothetical protein